MKKTCAFSLIELVVVVVILGILVAVVVQRIGVTSEMRAAMAANELAVNLRHVRNIAAQRERTTRVSFDPESNSYSVDIYNSDQNAFTPAANPLDQRDWIVYISDRFPGVSIAGVNIGGGNTLFFHATNAIPLGAGENVLTDAGTIVFNTGVTVAVAPDTGYIEILQ